MKAIEMRLQDFLKNYDSAAEDKTEILKGEGVLADNVFWYQPRLELVDYSNWDGKDYSNIQLGDEKTLISQIKDISLTVCAALFDFNDRKIYQSLVKDLDFYAFNNKMAVPVIWYKDYFYGGVMFKFPHLIEGNYALIVHEEWMINGKYFNRYHDFKLKASKQAISSIHNIPHAINFISNKYDSGSHVTRNANEKFPFGNQSFSIYTSNIPKLYFDVASNVIFQKFNGTDEEIFNSMGLNSIERLNCMTYKKKHKVEWDTVREYLAAKKQIRTRLKFRTETDPATSGFSFTTNYNDPSKLVKLSGKKRAADFINYYVPVNLPL